MADMQTPATKAQEPVKIQLPGFFAEKEEQFLQAIADFQDPSQEWRRLFSELYGTFLLVLVAAGGGMMSQAFPGTITRTAAVVAPGLMVMAIIMFMGKISGAHLNPAVSIAFSLRGDFPWRRVPGYVIVQLLGATLASLVLWGVVDVSAKYGGNYPASGYSDWRALLMETLLTFGLVSVILGTASGAQNIGIIGAIGVGSLHRARRAVGKPDLGCLDESGPHVRARPRVRNVDRVLALHRRPDRRSVHRGGLCVRPPRSGWRQGGISRGAGRALHRGATRPGLSPAVGSRHG